MILCKIQLLQIIEKKYIFTSRFSSSVQRFPGLMPGSAFPIKLLHFAWYSASLWVRLFSSMSAFTTSNQRFLGLPAQSKILKIDFYIYRKTTVVSAILKYRRMTTQSFVTSDTSRNIKRERNQRLKKNSQVYNYITIFII